jgi:cold shock CspA family protein
MRYQGKITVWKDNKGFGFVVPNGGGPDVFLHISAFGQRRKRPEVGDVVTYELSFAESDRPKAANVMFVERQNAEKANGSSLLPVILAGVLVLAFVGYIAYVRLSHPNSTVSASLYKVFFARSALYNDDKFQCTPPKKSCSQMTSCAEAFFHQERCGATGMDGDRDGIPCERQWCN